MEIPSTLKKLYKHWEFHTSPPVNNKQIRLNPSVRNGMIHFASERMRIWEQKTQGLPPPYTRDPILVSYRFCNVYRELDKQTIEFHSLLKPLTSDFPLWLLNMLYCRLVCNPATVKQTGLLSFDPRHNRRVRDRLENLPRPKYGAAYVFPISVIQRSPFPTRERFFCEYLPSRIRGCANLINKFNRLGVSEALPQILPAFGFNLKFHWTEVLIDVAYQYPQYIDLFGPFPAGPGSISVLSQVDLASLVSSGPGLSFPFLTYLGHPVFLSAENWEGIACEFRKYSNLRNNNGRKRLYH